MRVVVQRVSEASVTVDGSVVGRIEGGLLCLVGTTHGDTAADAVALASKIGDLRIFQDADGKMNLSVRDIGGGVLVVSQFTLYGDVRKGRRPSFVAAGDPAEAEPLVETFGDALASSGLPVSYGRFGAMMEVALINDGPVTLVVEASEGRVH